MAELEERLRAAEAVSPLPYPAEAVDDDPLAKALEENRRRSEVLAGSGPAIQGGRPTVEDVIVPAGAEDMTDEELVRVYVEAMQFTEEQARAYVEIVRGRGEGEPVD